MKHIRLFETQEQYDEVSYKLDYPCISLIEDEIDGSLIYEDEPSWVKCTYEIPQEALDGGTTSFLIMNNAKSVVKAYKVNGEMVDIEPIRIEESEKDIWAYQTIQDETAWLPIFESLNVVGEFNNLTTFTLSRPITDNDNILMMMGVDGEIAPLNFTTVASIKEAGIFNDYFSFIDDTHYVYGDILVESMNSNNSGLEGYHIGIFFVNEEWSLNVATTTKPTLETNAIIKTVSGGLKNIVIDNTVIDENNQVTIEYKLQNGITEINNKFNNIDYLKEVDFSGLTTKLSLTIAKSAFTNNICLEKVIFNMPNLTIGDYAFSECPSLNYVDLSQLAHIEPNTFYNCTNLTTLLIPNTVQISTQSFIKSIPNLTELIFEEGHTEIMEAYCANSTKLTSITIPDSVTTIGDGCFSGCTSLETIVIPNRVTEIGWNLFRNCTSLSNVTIGSGVTTINNYAFLYCSQLTSITIPQNVSTLGSAIFEGCSSLQSITCKAINRPSISNWTFNKIPSNGTLYYPKGSDYSSWMRTDVYYLGYYNWTSQEVEFSETTEEA